MDNLNNTTEHRKGQHLTEEERNNIEVHLKDGWSAYKIAKHLCRPYNTVKNEIKRGTVLLRNGQTKQYKAAAGRDVYLHNRLSCRKPYHRLDVTDFISMSRGISVKTAGR